jgi:hypothetical protein
MPAQDNQEIEQLRQLVSQGAKTIDARSNEPDAALNALQDLEDQIRQMSAGDDQLASALAAIASALASDPATQQLANAINTGDMRQISQAMHELAQQSDQMSGQDKARVAKVLRDASARAQRSSQSVSSELASAASPMPAAAGADGADMTQAGQQAGAEQAAAPGQSMQSAQDSLNQLADSAAAASERQRAQSQLESSRNALERALGRTQSRSGTGSSGRSSSQSSSNGQRSNSSSGGSQSSDASQGGAQGQNSGDMGDNGDPASGGGTSGDNGDNGQAGDGSGSGYSTGGNGQNHSGTDSGLDVITRPEQLPNTSGAAPDTSSINPYLADGANGSAQASEEAVQPSYSRKPTQGNDSASIPLGLRDLVKDYFSSLDQK